MGIIERANYDSEKLRRGEGGSWSGNPLQLGLFADAYRDARTVDSGPRSTNLREVLSLV